MFMPTVGASFALFADSEWVGLVIFLVIIAGRFVAYLAGGNKPKAPGKAARPQANPGRAPRPPQPQAAGGKQREEIEEFLRRVAARRQGGPAQDVEVLAPQRPAAAGEGRIAVAEVVEEFPAGQTVETHVRQHMDTTQYDRRAADMSHEVDTADDMMEEHMHKVFDHDVGLLNSPGDRAERAAGSGPAPSLMEETPPRRVSSVVGHLNDTASIRDAIIVSEVLRRPVERW